MIRWSSVFDLRSLVFIAAALLPTDAPGEDNYKRTDSRSQYAHYIQLYDARDRLIVPSDPHAPPYSPRMTCRKCHDYAAISGGYHFTSPSGPAVVDRPGEPWIWTHLRTGSQIPLSLRDWPGTFRPQDVGLTSMKFVQQFGSHMCGGGLGEPGSSPTQSNSTDSPVVVGPNEGRWRITGHLEVDCMFCHSGNRSYSQERWAKQIAAQNFAWAASAALGIAKIVGTAKGLSDDTDLTTSDAQGVQTKYDLTKFDSEGRVFFDLVRKPPNNACYACHSARPVGKQSLPLWTQDEDVHLRAGFACSDCHRNGIGHHTVRGFEGEVHPSGLPVGTLSCRGCHMEQALNVDNRPLGGRLGAPQPLHKGLPPLHLEKMSCTSCHAGPRPGRSAQRVQTAMAHALGIPSQTRQGDDPPGILQPVFMRDQHGVLYPYRMTWPAFWGWMTDDKITPMNPEQVHKLLRRTLRVRKDLRKELAKVQLTTEEMIAALGPDAASQPREQLTQQQQSKLDTLLHAKGLDQFRQKLAIGLQKLAEQPEGNQATAVYVADGKVYLCTDPAGSVQALQHAAAEPYAWPIGHDVRPARYSLGVGGCAECHASDSPMFYGTVQAVGPVPDDPPKLTKMYELLGEDPALLATWEKSFQGRNAFKWIGSIAVGCLVIILVLYLMLGLNGLLRMVSGE